MENTIISGETSIIQTNEFEWQKNISSGEYLDIESIEIGVNNTISLRKKIPFYKYMINFLLLSHYQRLGIKPSNVGDISSEIFSNIENNQKNEILENLVDLIVELFKERGLSPEGKKSEVYGSLDYEIDKRKIWKKTQIRKDLKARTITRDKMFIYSFGLGMNLQELEVFLMKVLEETGLNIWDNKEAMIYIALNHFKDRSLDFFIRANYLYENASADDLVVEKKDTNLNTTILQNSLDDYINANKDSQDLDDKIILNIISYHKDLVSENTNRTILSEFISRFYDLEEGLSDEIEAFSNVKYGNDDGDGLNADYFSRGNISIFYKSDRDIEISNETPFVFESKESGETKTYYPETSFILEKNPKGGEKIVTVQSAYYNFKDEVPLLGTGEEYEDFAYRKGDIEEIYDVKQDSIYISEKKISSLLSYLYNEDALILRDDSTLPKDQVEALDDLLKDTRIKHENLNAIIEKRKISQITRSRLITLYFLSYVLEKEDLWYDLLSTPQKRKRDYLIYMDFNLRNARLYEYNISNPYEETLLKLVMYDEPIDAFRDLWAKYLVNLGVVE